MKNALFRKIVINDPTKKSTPQPDSGVTGIGRARPASSPAVKGQDRPRMGAIRNNEATIMTRQMPFDNFTIKRAQVMYMSQEELEKMSILVMHDDNNGILQSTIHDPRMGPLDAKKTLCSSCELSKSYCPGHLGRIDLVEPIIKQSAYDYVVYVLQSVCHKCGSLLLDREVIESYDFSSGPERLRQIALKSAGTGKTGGQHCRNPACKYFGGYNPKMTTKPGKMISIDVNSNGTIVALKSSTIVKIFDAISKEDLAALGFKDTLNDKSEVVYKNHPNNFIFQSFPVIPECHRPIVMTSEGREKDDPLTSIYRRILEINNTLKEMKLSGSTVTGSKKEFTIEDLDFAVSSLLKAGDDKSAINSLEAASTIKGRLSKKKGYFRCYAMGKRGNRTGRSVLGSVSIPFGFIGIPKEIANSLTIIERVCDKNFDYLNKLFAEGKIPFIVNSKERMNVERKRNARLEIGNEVWRYLQDGDPIIFNRQPTLHKQSMMGYLVKTYPGKSLGLHSSCTTPHNADFDGDDGNIYVTTSYQARAEIIFLASCWNNIIYPQFSRPAMGIVFNGITAAYLMSKHGPFTQFLWDEGLQVLGKFQDRVQRTGMFPSLMERGSRWYSGDNLRCGAMLFSSLLPQDFWYSHKGVQIINGIIVPTTNGKPDPDGRPGVLAKKHVGDKTGSIVHQLYHNYGTNVAARFFSECQFLMDWFIMRIGFTVGYADCSVGVDEAVRIKAIVLKETEKAQAKIESLGLPHDNMSQVELDYREETIRAALGNVTTAGTEIVKSGLSVNNNLRIMADSGAKGSVTNIAQITGLIGQQSFRGKRPPLKFNMDKYGKGRRFLPYYDVEPKGGVGNIENHGFVATNFNEGMRPGQYFAHMMNSRTGIIDRALGTAATGHMSRIINKTLEDVRLGYNGTVCKDNGGVIEYVFGSDGYDPKALIETNTPGTGMMWSPIDVSSIVSKLNAEVDYPLQ